MNRYRTLLLRVLAIGIVLTAMTGLTSGQSSSDPLEQGFQQPPDSAQAAGVVALDEWQHQQGRHQAGSGVDASRTDWQDSRTSMPRWPRLRWWITGWPI